MIIKIEKSPKQNKRYRVTLDDGRIFDFGLDSGSTYIDHHDKEKRFNYVKRHMANKTEKQLIENLVPSPALFSMILLWGPYADLHKNIEYLNNLWKEKHGGSAKNAGYVRRMEAEGKLELHKVTNPSKHLQNKYGQQPQQQLPIPEPEPQAPQHEAPIFYDNENVEFNVAKPKKKIQRTQQPTEAQEERAQEERITTVNYLQNLKANLVALKKELGKENSKYLDVLEEVRTRKGLKKDERTNLEQEARNRYVNNINKIKQKYKDVYQFIKNNRLNDNDLNNVHQYIRDKIKSL